MIESAAEQLDIILSSGLKLNRVTHEIIFFPSLIKAGIRKNEIEEGELEKVEKQFKYSKTCWFKPDPSLFVSGR